MRAARTPPEPPPMTNRSVSKSLIARRVLPLGPLEIVPLLLHLGAEAVHHFFRDTRTPLLHETESRIEHLRLLHQHLLPERRLEERHQLLQLGVAEARSVLPRRLVHQFGGARRIFGA